MTTAKDQWDPWDEALRKFHEHGFRGPCQDCGYSPQEVSLSVSEWITHHLVDEIKRLRKSQERNKTV